MNIKSINNTQSAALYKYQKLSNKKSNNNDSRSGLKSLSFSGNYNSQVIKNFIDVPIQNNKEFNRVMRRVKHSKIKANRIWELLNPFRRRVWIDRNYKNVFSEYENASDVEMGLIPYCGQHDNSEAINMFLSGRLEQISTLNHYVRIPQNIDSYVDVVRTLDYALKNLDDEFGKYKGIVYRVGYMSEEGNQYFSTSKSLTLVKRMRPVSYQFNPNMNYSVIRLKNGHKIYEFQNKMGSNFAKIEDEVLTDRNSKFKKLATEEMDEELINAKQELAKNLFFGADEIMAGIKSDYYKYDIERLLKFVNVYEEV